MPDDGASFSWRIAFRRANPWRLFDFRDNSKRIGRSDVRNSSNSCSDGALEDALTRRLDIDASDSLFF